MSFPVNTGISMRFVLNWPIIFRERISGSMFRWRRLVRHFNFVPGNCCVQFQTGETRSIRGWAKKLGDVEMRPARSEARQRRRT
jgi:hypothetical protein